MLREQTDNMSTTSNTASTSSNTSNSYITNTDTPKIPAWKLRRQQLQQNREVPVALYAANNDELGGSRSSRSSRGSSQQMRKGGRYKNFSDTGSIASAGSTQSTSSMSTRSTSSFYSRGSRSSNASCHVSRSIRPVSRVPGGLDPSVPPAFRAALKLQQQQREKKNTNCLASSVASHSRTLAVTATSHQECGSDLSSLDSDDENNDFDDEDSFASVDSKADEEDDDAYQLSRNQMARFEIDNMPRPRDRRPKSRFQKKTTGVHGTPLGLIAE